MKNESIVIKINAEKHSDIIEMFQTFRKNSHSEKDTLPVSLGYLLKEYNRLLKFESDFKNDLIGAKLSAREAQKQGYMILTVLNTFLYENEFGLSTPLFLNDKKTDMLRAIEQNYDNFLKEIQIKAANQKLARQNQSFNPNPTRTDEGFGSFSNDLFM